MPSENVKVMPSQEVLRSLLRYDPETGRLFRLVPFPGQKSDEAFTYADRRGYKHGKINGTNYQAHRIIWKIMTGNDPETIDHINGVQSDNRWSNLREATVAENCRNYKKKRKGSSVYRGVCWVKREAKWSASIGVNCKKISLGHYDDESEAAKAYDAAARIHHGAFATLNFSDARQP